jgi:hypothetical protein
MKKGSVPFLSKTLTGPILKLLKMGRDIFPGGKCEVFYRGSVAPPTASSSDKVDQGPKNQ